MCSVFSLDSFDRYDFRTNVSSDNLPGFFTEEDLFTLPFEQDGVSYGAALATEIRNNTNIIFVDFTGIIDPPNRVANSKNRDLRILVTIVVVVVASVFVALGVIAYLTRFREPDDAFAPDSPVGAMIGVNTTENILLSENYEYGDDYRSPLSSATGRETKKGSPGDRSTPSGPGSDPPLQEVRGDASSPNVATTISDIGSTGDAPDRHKSGQSAGSVHSANQLTPGGANSPFDDLSPSREKVEDYLEDSEAGTNDVDSTADQSAPPPFMADFQMEIKDIE